MAYDRADWHYGGDFPADLPPEAGGTHIGMFLAWAIHRGLEGAVHHEGPREEAALGGRARARMTGREFLMGECDEKFWTIDLNDEGNRFARDYYETNRYYDDYGDTLASGLPTLYHVEDTWENFDKLAAVLDWRYREWKSKASA